MTRSQSGANGVVCYLLASRCPRFESLIAPFAASGGGDNAGDGPKAGTRETGTQGHRNGTRTSQPGTHGRAPRLKGGGNEKGRGARGSHVGFREKRRCDCAFPWSCTQR